MTTTDPTTSVSELKSLVQRFVDERDWQRFHTPKNLAMSVAIEAAELMELFQWIESDEADRRADEQREALEDEVADVVCYLLSLANATGIDVAAAVERKLRKNAEKYPADRFRGRFE